MKKKNSRENNTSSVKGNKFSKRDHIHIGHQLFMQKESLLLTITVTFSWQHTYIYSITLLIPLLYLQKQSEDIADFKLGVGGGGWLPLLTLLDRGRKADRPCDLSNVKKLNYTTKAIGLTTSADKVNH